MGFIFLERGRMEMLAYVPFLLSFLASASKQPTNITNVAFNKKVLISSSLSRVAYTPANAVDDSVNTSSITGILNAETWTAVDLYRPYHVGRIALKVKANLPRGYTMTPRELYILTTNEITTSPNPQKHEVCWRFDENKDNQLLSAEVECWKKRNTPPFRFVVLWTPAARHLQVFDLKVYPAESCPVGYYGSECDRVCHCRDDVPCSMWAGTCPLGCHEDYTGPHCDRVRLDVLKFGCGRGNETGEVLEDCRKYCYDSNNDVFYLEDNVCRCRRFTDSVTNASCAIEHLDIYTVCPVGFYGYKCSLRCACASHCSLDVGECLPQPTTTTPASPTLPKPLNVVLSKVWIPVIPVMAGLLVVGAIGLILLVQRS